MDIVVTSVRRLWLKSNSQFMPPVTVEDKSVKKKLMDAWGKASDITMRRITKQKIISSFEEKLDKLLDLTVCQCVIELCVGVCSSTRCSGFHISCDCSREIKLPVLELKWILDQRSKKGEKMCKICMVNLDKVETERLRKAEKRKQEKLESDERAEKRKQQEQEEELLRVEEDIIFPSSRDVSLRKIVLLPLRHLMLVLALTRGIICQ